MKPRKIKINAVLQARLIKLLLEAPHSAKELALETGLHYLTCLDYLRALHKEKAAYIAAYAPDTQGRHSIKQFALGSKPDAKRIRLTQAQRQARVREKKRAIQTLMVLAGKGEFIPRKNGRYLFVQKLPLDTQLELS